MSKQYYKLREVYAPHVWIFMRRHYWKTGTKSVFACVPSDNFLTKETEESTSDSVISTSVLLYEFWSEQMEEVGGEEIVEQLLLLMLRIGVLDLRVFSFCNPWFLLLIDHRVCSPSLTQLDLTVYLWKLFVPWYLPGPPQPQVSFLFEHLD